MQSYAMLIEQVETLKQEIRNKNALISKLQKRIVDVQGWKGTDAVSISREGNYWTLTEHRKEKETGNIKTTTHTIPDKNVQDFLEVLKTFGNKKVTYREFVPELIKHHQKKGNFPTDVNVENIGGGKNRDAYYFPYYQFCARICEETGIIKYTGRGDITLKKEGVWNE